MFALNAFVRIPFPFAFQLSRESTPASILQLAVRLFPPSLFRLLFYLSTLLATLSSVVSPIYNPREWLLATRIRRVLHEGGAGGGIEETYIVLLCGIFAELKILSPSAAWLPMANEENHLGTILRNYAALSPRLSCFFFAFRKSFGIDRSIEIYRWTERVSSPLTP